MGPEHEFATAWSEDVPDLELLVRLVSAAGRRNAPEPGPLLDRVAERVGGTGPVGGAGVVSALFADGWFRGDDRTYGSPENSLLDRVLERRLGIPLSLSVVAILVGRRLGVSLEAVGMPRHVLLRDPDAGLLHDVFDLGRPLDESGAEALLRRVDPGLPWTPEHLATMTTREVVDRWCRNLRVARATAGDGAGVDAVLDLELTRPDPPLDAVLVASERAVARGAFLDAATMLERHAPAGGPGEAWRARAARLRATMN